MQSIHVPYHCFFGNSALRFGLCVFNFSLGFSTILFTAAAVVGYKMFGESTVSVHPQLTREFVGFQDRRLAYSKLLLSILLQIGGAFILNHVDLAADFCCRWQIQ